MYINGDDHCLEHLSTSQGKINHTCRAVKGFKRISLTICVVLHATHQWRLFKSMEGWDSLVKRRWNEILLWRPMILLHERSGITSVKMKQPKNPLFDTQFPSFYFSFFSSKAFFGLHQSFSNDSLFFSFLFFNFSFPKTFPKFCFSSLLSLSPMHAPLSMFFLLSDNVFTKIGIVICSRVKKPRWMLSGQSNGVSKSMDLLHPHMGYNDIITQAFIRPCLWACNNNIGLEST